MHHHLCVEMTVSITCMSKRQSFHTHNLTSLMSYTCKHLHAQAADDAQQLHVCRCEHAHLHTRVSESSKSTNSKFRLCKISAAPEHGDVLPGVSVYLVLLSTE